MRVGQNLLQLLDRIEGLDRQAAIIFGTGADGEGQGIEDQIAGADPVSINRDVVQSLRDLDFSVACLGHTLFVNRQGNECRTVAFGQSADSVHPFA